jgi:hypothetical protein
VSSSVDDPSKSESSFFSNEQSIDEQISTVKYTFDVGKSIEHVSLNMVLHFYQLTPKDRIVIKFTMV